jgi:hypothetical protein
VIGASSTIIARIGSIDAAQDTLVQLGSTQLLSFRVCLALRRSAASFHLQVERLDDLAVPRHLRANERIELFPLLLQKAAI